MTKPCRAIPFLIGLILAFASSADDAFRAANDDIVAPWIEHTPIFGEVLNELAPLGISAKVADNSSVQSVVVYYRTVGMGEFERLVMKPSQDDIYAATIPGQAIQPPGLEYYIEATDVAGNTSLKGATFSPIRLSVQGDVATPDTSASSGSSQNAQTASGESGNKWFWIIGGALAVGAISALSNGGDDGGTTAASAPDNPPATTITVTGNVPN